MSNNEKPVIIIRRHHGGDHDEGHGGAWKVAFADFMTAMMAFFLLMWLLSLSEDDKLQGIAEYFSTDEVALTSYGGEDVLSGKVLQEIVRDRLSDRVEFSGAQADENDREDANSNGLAPVFQPGVENPWKDLTEAEEDDIAGALSVPEALKDIEEMLEEDGELADLAENVMLHEVSGNYRIEILESDKTPLFESGKSDLSEENLRILKEISVVLMEIPEKINITGHTDAMPYRSKGSYSNWELSTDRANATRRALKEFGFPGDRMGRVAGASDRELLNTSDPFASENRRVTIEIASGSDAAPKPEIISGP